MIQKKTGFTLIELITTIIIVGLVLILSIPVYNSITGKTKKTAYENKIKLIEVAASNYASEFKNEIKASPEVVCVGLNTLIKENHLVSDSKEAIYLSNPNPGGVEPGDQLKGLVELSYVNDQILAIYKLDGVCNVLIDSLDDSEDRYDIDLTPPTGSMYILEGDYTNQTTVHLVITLPDADAVSFCYKDTAEGTCMIDRKISDYNINSIPYNLTDSTNRDHQVFMWLKDKYGNVGGPFDDSIFFDDKKPTGGILINGGADYTTSRNVSLTLNYSDITPGSGVNLMCISNTSTCPAINWKSVELTQSWELPLPGDDGDYTVYVWYKDRAGNISDGYNAEITLDRTPPTNGSITINEGDIYTTNATVNLELFSTDLNSGVAEMCISNIAVCPIGNWETYSPIKSNWQLIDGDGNKTVYARFKDGAGNISVASVFDTIILDTMPPTDNAITIAGGEAYTTNQIVSLELSSTGANEMCISNSETCFSWEAYSETKNNWTLIDGDGEKTVYAWFRDAARNTAPRVFDTIILDKTPPTGNTITIAGGATYTTNSTVNLGLTSTGATQMCISNSETCSSWEAYSITKNNWTLTAGDGEKTVYAWFRDSVGNTAARVFDTIILDTTPPTNNSVTIAGGATYTTSTLVNLTLASTDASLMCISNSATCTLFSAYNNTYNNWTLNSAEGQKTVSAWFRDAAGNTSVRVLDTIILDTVAPTGTISINNGDESTDSTSVTLTFTNVEATSGIYQRCVSNSSTCPVGNWETYSASKNWTLTTTIGLKRVYVWFKDNAGNISLRYNDTIDYVGDKPVITFNVADLGSDYLTVDQYQIIIPKCVSTKVITHWDAYDNSPSVDHGKSAISTNSLVAKSAITLAGYSYTYGYYSVTATCTNSSGTTEVVKYYAVRNRDDITLASPNYINSTTVTATQTDVNVRYNIRVISEARRAVTSCRATREYGTVGYCNPTISQADYFNINGETEVVCGNSSAQGVIKACR